MGRAAWAQLPDGNREGIFAGGDETRQMALGDLRVLHAVLLWHGGSAGRPAIDRIIFQVLRLLRAGRADARTLSGGSRHRGLLAGLRPPTVSGFSRRTPASGPRR